MTFQDIFSLVLTLLQGLIQGFASQLVVITLFFVLIWKVFEKPFRRFRIQLTQRAGWAQIKEELINTALVIAGGVFTSPLIMYANSRGWTTLYADPFAYGIPYLIFNWLTIWLIADAWFYFMHRALHHPKLYRYIHAVHHQSLDTTPYTALSFHWLEPILLSLWIYIVIFIFPISLVALGINQVFGLLNNIKSHLGYELYPKWFNKTPLRYLVNSTHHNQHHTRYNGNYGLSLRFWDLLFKTEFDDFEKLVNRVQGRGPIVPVVSNTVYRPLTISRIVPETTDTSSIYFDTQDPAFLNYLPGQHLNLRIKVGRKIYERVFSLSSAPKLDPFLRITVKQNRIVTDHLRHHAKPGDVAQALFPVGAFTVDPANVTSAPLLLIAGGSGITPLYSILRSVLAEAPDRRVTLLYASRSRAGMTFGAELSALARQHPNFTFEAFISGERRLNRDALADALHAVPDANVYICGPLGLKSEVKQHLGALGVPRDRMHEEDFADGFVSMLNPGPRGTPALA
jgi:ring-1,2-phenylacetyl-CoA epoxidase subunit PaaE